MPLNRISGAGLLICLAGLSTLATLAATNAQSLNETMHWALRSSFDRKADDERQAGLEAQTLSSYEAFLPTAGFAINRPLSSRITYTPDLLSDPLIPGQTDTLQRWQPDTEGFQLTMPLFDGLKRFNLMQAARSAEAAGRGLQDDKAQQILLETASAYLAVLRDRAVIRLREAAIADVQKVARSVALRREVHDATNSELALAESRVVAAQTFLEQAQANLFTSEAELIRLAGSQANPSGTPYVPDELLPKSLDELRAIVLGQNPKLVASRLNADSAKYVANASFSRYSPQLNFQFTKGRQGVVSNTPYRIRETTAMLQLLVPIYAPGHFGDVAREHAFARQKGYEALDLERTLVAQATAAFNQRRSTIVQVRQADERVRKIARAVQGRQMELRLGSMTIVDVLNTVAELAEARVAKIQLEYSRDRATYALAAVMNRLRA